MQPEVKKLIADYQAGGTSKKEVVSAMSLDAIQKQYFVREVFSNIVLLKQVNNVGSVLTLFDILEENDEYIDLVHQLLLETWHTEYERIAHNLQGRKNVASISFLKEAMQRKYGYLESYGTGTRQFINQCGHALKRIGTTEAIEAIKELSNSDDPVVRDEMLYRLSDIEGRDDYERNYDL